MPRIYSLEDSGVYTAGYAGASPWANIATNGLAICQPVQHEFQRYPGHPATTCLSPVFGNTNDSPSMMPVTYPYPSNPLSSDAALLNPYYNIAPRVGLTNSLGGGGSLGGSAQAQNNNPVMNTDADRLYASVDELMFTPLTNVATGTSRIPNTAVATATPNLITKSAMEKARFFITANSTAPETTLYNTPRIAIWPIWDSGPISYLNATYDNPPVTMASGTAARTTYDNLIAFCSSINPQTNPNNYYYFTRSNARSSTADSALPRNQQLFQYLRALTSNNEPGFGGNFQAKYPAGPVGITDCDQILTSIFDYVRCTNLQDRSTLPSGAAAIPFTPIFTTTTAPIPGAGEVLPIQIAVPGGTAQGFGRFDSISSANIIFYATQNAYKPPGPPVTFMEYASMMRAMFCLGFADPMHGLACMESNLKYKITGGLDQLQWADPTTGVWQSMNFQPGGTDYIDVNDDRVGGGRGTGGNPSPAQSLAYGNGGGLTKVFNDALGAGQDVPPQAGNPYSSTYPLYYPWYSSSDITLPSYPTQVAGLNSFLFRSVPGTTIDLEIRSVDTNALIQTLHFSFPQTRILTPNSGALAPGTSNYGARNIWGSAALAKFDTACQG